MFVCLVAITSASPKVGVTASKLVPIREKMGFQGVSKLFQINLAFLDVRSVIDVSINILFGFSFLRFFFVFLFNIVTGLNVREFNQMYEILGWSLGDPIACETHGASH